MKRITSKTGIVLKASRLFRRCFEDYPGGMKFPREKVGYELNKLSAEFLEDLVRCLQRARWNTEEADHESTMD